MQKIIRLCQPLFVAATFAPALQVQVSNLHRNFGDCSGWAKNARSTPRNDVKNLHPNKKDQEYTASWSFQYT